MRLLREVLLLMKVATLGGRGIWAGVRRGITAGPKVPLTLCKRRGLEGDREGTVAGLEVDADIYATEARTKGGGAFPSSYFIVRG